MSAKILNTALLTLSMCAAVCIALKCFSEPHVSDLCFDPAELVKFAEMARAMEKLSSEQLRLLSEAGFVVGDDQPAAELFMGFELPKSMQKLQSYGNTIITFLDMAVHHLGRELGMSRQQVLHCFAHLNLTADKYGICERYPDVECEARNLIYQPMDGLCALPGREAHVGAKNTPFRRLLGSGAYEDSIHEVRASIRDKSALPSARLIASGQRTLHVSAVYGSRENLHNDLLIFHMKLITLDIIKSVKEQSRAGSFGIDCCDLQESRMSSQHCMPIEIPLKDRVYRKKNCMNYVRAMVTHDNCKIQAASILNAVTHFMDMDFIYDPENVRIALSNGAFFPDTAAHVRQLISIGDERTAMLPQLHALVLVWIRFHNQIARQLRSTHASLSDDALFFETRRLVIAVYQGVWQREVLPLLLSDAVTREYALDERESCFDPRIDPVISAEFATAASRHFHKYIRSNYSFVARDGRRRVVTLAELYSSEIDPYDEFEGLLDGLLQSPLNSDEIAGYLFATQQHPGIDLRTLDVQAERDFGVAGYCEFLYHFNLTDGKCIRRFTELREFISEDDLAFLKYAYYDPHDIDLSVGADMHATHDEPFMSEVFERIFAEQFHRLMCGDPYFYTNALGEDQVAIVDEVSYGDVLCMVAPNMSIQSFALITPGVNNTAHSCEGISLHLDNWKLLCENGGGY